MQNEILEGNQKRRSRVLIVDNSPVMRKIINEVLVALPRMEVVGQAKDGMEALECIQQLQPDIVIMDIQMPRMSGLEALRKLPPGRCRVIMLSAAGEEIYVEKCRQLKAEHFFDKITGFQEFVECVAAM
jgi:chemotaxis response regulator CheB